MTSGTLRPGLAARVLPAAPEERRALRRDVIRVLVVGNFVLGLESLRVRWT